MVPLVHRAGSPKLGKGDDRGTLDYWLAASLLMRKSSGKQLSADQLVVHCKHRQPICDGTMVAKACSYI